MSGSSNGAVERVVRLPDGVDLHARPAGLLVRTAAAHGATVILRSGEREADARSILQVMALGATGGTELVVRASGDGASAALDAVAGLLATIG
jgi:phosphoenolpyruvate---glycerone phosphotransferase subunit DhaM